MRNSIRLDSFLVSSSAGMDLTKGVPEKRGETQNSQLKDELSFENSLDHSMKIDREIDSKRDLSSDRQGIDDSKKAPTKATQSEQGSKSEESKAQVEHKDVRKQASKPQKELSEEASNEDEIQEQKPLRNQIIDALELEQNAEVVAENKVEVPKEQPAEDENLQGLPLSVQGFDVETQADVITEEASEVDVELPPVKIEIAEGSAEDAVAVDSKAEAVELPAELQPVFNPSEEEELEVEMDSSPASDKSVKTDDSMNLELETESEASDHSDDLSFSSHKDQPTERVADVKDFAAELWIQRNVDAESRLSGRSDIQVQLTQDTSAPKPILMRDLNPLISKVITTNTGGEMSLQLKPLHLGNVKIDILVEGSSVRVNMQTEKAAAQSVLQSQVSELKQQFNAVGLKVDSININTSQGNASEHAKDGQQQHSPKHHQEQAERQAHREAVQREFEMDGLNEEAA